MLRVVDSVPPTVDRLRQRGQATVEYVLVMVGAAAVALLVLAWATGTGKVGELLDTVLDTVLGRAV